jgi:hypothetical protein
MQGAVLVDPTQKRSVVVGNAGVLEPAVDGVDGVEQGLAVAFDRALVAAAV